MDQATTLPARKDVPIIETWNLSSIFPDADAWGDARMQVEKRLPKLATYQGELGKSPRILLEYLELAEEVTRLGLKVMVYAGLDFSTDVSDQAAAARANQGSALMAMVRAARAFENPELMSIGFAKLRDWMAVEPELAVYSHFIDDLERLSRHVLDAEAEQVLALATDPLPVTQAFMPYSSLVNAELKFTPAIESDGAEHEVGQSSIDALRTHPDREVRRTAYASYADAYLAFKNTLAGTQTMAFQRDVFYARSRRYPSTLEASLARGNVPSEVFYNLIEVFQRNLPLWQRYWRIRRKALGLDELRVYDIKAPLSEAKVNIPYQQAVDWICTGMAPLGDEYVDILRAGCTTDRWVDRALNRGKRQGAFSWGAYDTQPFIMMSYAQDVFSLSTLAHELGHSMHSYYTRATQPFVYGQYSLFVAEVASNFNQAMVRDYLFKTQTDPQFQLALIDEAMSNFHRYFFIMPTLARWELEMHQKVEGNAPVNAEIYTRRCAELFAEGYGEEVAFDPDEIGITWAQFSHMYMNYYVYQYATGIAGAHALAERVLAGEDGAAERYIEFLKSGGSLYPLDALQRAGVDMTRPEPVEKAFGVMAGVVDRLEALVS